MLSFPYIVKKRPFSQKHGVLMSFFQYKMKNPLLSCPYLVKNHQNCQKAKKRKTRGFGWSFNGMPKVGV